MEMEIKLLKKHWLIIVFSIIFLLKGIAYAVIITPPSLYEAPDEVGHFSYIHYIQDEKKLPVLNVTSFYRNENTMAGEYTKGIKDYSSHKISDEIMEKGCNWIIQHPPAYYALMAPILQIGRVFTDKLVYLVYLLRIATVLLGVLFLIYSYKLLKLLKRNKFFIGIFLTIAVFSPMIQYYYSVISNDSLVILLSVMSLFYLIKYQKYSNKVDMILFVVFANLILLTKYTGALILVPYALFFIYLLIKKFAPKKVILSLLICIWITLVIIGPFFARNIILYDKLLPTKNQIYSTDFDYGFFAFLAEGYINEIYKHLCCFVGWLNFVGTDIYVRYFYSALIGVGTFIFSFLKAKENNLNINKKRYIIIASFIIIISAADAVWGMSGRNNLGLYVIIALVGIIYSCYHLLANAKLNKEHDVMLIFFMITIFVVVLGLMYTHFNVFNRNGILIATHGRYYLILSFPFIYIIAHIYDNFLYDKSYYKYIACAIGLLCFANEMHIINYLMRIWN
jgi:hypothetical protein